MAEEIINGIFQEGAGSAGSAGNFGPIVARSLVGGVLAVGGAGNIEVTSQTGATDTLDSFTGCEIGRDYRIQPTSGDTITVADSASIILQGVDFIMNNVNDNMTLHCISANVLKEITRASND